MKLVTAFFMAWGNFFSAPCPYKKWDENCKRLMLVFLPVIGGFIGGIWYLLWLFLGFVEAPLPIAAAALTLVPFLLSGFIHLDGFMDCMDAILSRRAIEERLKILKDPCVGSFAVITTIIIFLLSAAAMYSILNMGIGTRITGGTNHVMLALVLVPVMSRIQSSIAVLTRRPLASSQYNKASFLGEEGMQKYDRDSKISRGSAAETVLLTIIKWMIIFASLAVVIYDTVIFYNTAGSLSLLDAADIGMKLRVQRHLTVFVAVVVTTLSHHLACRYGEKQFCGMSGDVSGFAITVSEVTALAVLSIL